jgi:hypothetical protein
MEEKNFTSPTTPGLMISFRAYLIETICLNQDKKLTPKFWNDEKYWGPKFRRECKGVANLYILLNLDKEDKRLQNIIIQQCKLLNIKSLSSKKVLEKLSKRVISKYNEPAMINDVLIEEHCTENNSFFINKNKAGIGKLRRLEKYGKKES